MNEYAINVNFIDLVKQQERIREPIEKAIQQFCNMVNILWDLRLPN